MILLFSLFLATRSAPLPPPAISTPGIGDYAVLAFRETISQSFNDRTIWDIVWSCVATILACTWSALHPNIPGPYDSDWRCLKRRVVTTFYALIAPEIVSLWALIQYIVARNSMRDYNKTIAKSEPPKETIIEGVKGWFLSRPPENHAQVEPWTMSHGFFVQMGGFLLYDAGKPIQVLNYARLKRCIDDGTIDPPDITSEEIQDRSKGDFISKGLVVLQTSWFILQCIARWSQKLPLSELEVVTLGFALLNGITYALWWNKPQDVRKAFRVTKKKTTQNPDNDKLKVSVVEPEKEAIGSEAADTPEGEEVPQTSINAVVHTAVAVTDPDIQLLPTLPSSNDAPPEALEDDKKQNSDNVLAGDITTGADNPEPPVYQKVKYVRRMLRADRSKVDGSWFSLLWFYGVMVPFRFIFYTLYAFLKMLDPVHNIEEGALRVSIFGSDAVEDSAYGGILLGSCVIGTLFGSVHLIAWWSLFPTPIEHLLWRISTAYVAGYPTFIFIGVFIVVIISEYFKVKGMQSPLPLLGYNILVWTGAALYGLSRSFIIFEAVLALRDLPLSVYKDVEWTIFIPHL